MKSDSFYAIWFGLWAMISYVSMAWFTIADDVSAVLFCGFSVVFFTGLATLFLFDGRKTVEEVE